MGNPWVQPAETGWASLALANLGCSNEEVLNELPLFQMQEKKFTMEAKYLSITKKNASNMVTF
jgi:hypothetical protein